MSGAAAEHTEAVRSALSADGALAAAIEGFRPRDDQIHMASAVATAMAQGSDLLCEAGTGTGKTFAYLTPALLGEQRVVVATGTRHLQDQLYWRDLDRVSQALGRRRVVALLKGRGNYLCRYRFGLERTGGALDPANTALLREIDHWQQRSRTGDLTELSSLPEDSPLWPRITSTVDNCLGADCPDYRDCHLVQARQQAQRADIIVVNHHLLCADLALKGEGFGDLLPAVDTIIVDEAHRFPDTAAGFFGERLSARQFRSLAQDVIAEQLAEASDLPQLRALADALSAEVRKARAQMGVATRKWRLDDRDQTSPTAALTGVINALQALLDGLATAEGRSKGLDHCRARAIQQFDQLNALCQASDTSVRWMETTAKGFQIGSIPIELGGVFAAARELLPANWIFTSATLAVSGSCRHFVARMGLGDDIEQLILQGPFDYARQAELILPEGLPDPRDAGFQGAFVQLARQVIDRSGGGLFILFTSLRALRATAEALSDLGERLLVQGSAPRHELLDRFRADGDAVLLGAASFWEGVDVSGSALRAVLIDKLPFASPDDPMVAARALAVERAGGSAFTEVLLPQAVLALKQGVGRLIRTETDSGFVVIADPRLRSKGYGRAFLRSLPPMPVRVGLPEKMAVEA